MKYAWARFEDYDGEITAWEPVGIEEDGSILRLGMESCCSSDSKPVGVLLPLEAPK